jgi:hypothetical protein
LAFAASAALLVIWDRGHKWAAAAALAAIAALLCILTCTGASSGTALRLWDDAVRAHPDRTSRLPTSTGGSCISTWTATRRPPPTREALRLCREKAGAAVSDDEPCLRLREEGKGYDEVYSCIGSAFAEMGRLQEAAACDNIARHPRLRGSAPPGRGATDQRTYALDSGFPSAAGAGRRNDISLVS